MKTRAAVTLKAEKALEIIEVDLQGVHAGRICHTDALTLFGDDPVCVTLHFKLLII